MKTSMLIMTTGIFLAGAMASAKSIDSSISGFNLKSCTPSHDKCLVVTAEKTQGSQMKMLQYLIKPELNFTSAKSKTLRGDSGYVDLEMNQLVLYKNENGHMTETSVDLGTLEMFSVETAVAR